MSEKTQQNEDNGGTPLAEPTGSAHPWHALQLWQKRAQGWISYQLASWASLVWPIEVDRAMHRELNEQFKKPNISSQPHAEDRA